MQRGNVLGGWILGGLMMGISALAAGTESYSFDTGRFVRNGFGLGNLAAFILGATLILGGYLSTILIRIEEVIRERKLQRGEAAGKNANKIDDK